MDELCRSHCRCRPLTSCWRRGTLQPCWRPVRRPVANLQDANEVTAMSWTCATQELANQRMHEGNPLAPPRNTVAALWKQMSRMKAKLHDPPSGSSCRGSESINSTSVHNEGTSSCGGFLPKTSHGEGGARSVQASGTAKVPPAVPFRMTVSTPATRLVLRMGNCCPRNG